MRIGLVQINNSFSNQNYLPYSVGLIKSYAMKYYTGTEPLDFKGLIYKRLKVQEALDEIGESDIVGFSSYVWNIKMSLKIAKELKRINPSCLIVFGGPQVPDNSEEFLRSNDFIDIAVHGEGEQTFTEILNNYTSKKFSDIQSTSRVLKDGTFIRNLLRPRIRLLDDIPSPYLTDAFSEIMQTHTDGWISMWETNRGCPFSCFTPNTKIITSFGKNKIIKNIKVGDRLVSFDEKSAELKETTVTKMFKQKTSNIYKITFEDDTIIKATGNHPFYIHGAWVPVEKLMIGDEVYTIDFRDKISLNKKIYNPVNNTETREKISKAIKNLYKNGFKSRFFEPGFQKNHNWRQNAVSYAEVIKKLSDSKKINNPMFKQETREKQSNTLKKNIMSGKVVPFMRTAEYWEKLKCTPNRQETAMIRILETEFGDKYEFCGDGSKRIGYYAPDFINESDKKIIEYNGCYWHGCEMCYPNSKYNTSKRDADRIKTFQDAGYKVKIVWSHQFKDSDSLLTELRCFTYNGKKIKSIEKIRGSYTVYNMECYPYNNYFAEYLLCHNCTFCDWGSATAAKLNQFGLDRLYQEVEWFSKNRIEFVSCCDANFGILPRDLDIVQKVVESKKRTGYPNAMSVQSTKNATERAYVVQKTLSDAGLNTGVTLSMQSMDEQTLSNVKRANISTKSFQYLQKKFTQDKIKTYTDMIIALPGETYDTFADGINQIIENGQHNRIQFQNLSLLPNAEMNNPESKKKFGLKYITSKIINMHGSLAELEDESTQELQELVVSTDAMPGKEWVKTRTLCWTVALLHFDKLFQIPIILSRNLGGISYRKIFEAFTNEEILKDFPILNEIHQLFIAKARSIQLGGEEYCDSKEWLNIWWYADEYAFIKLVVENKINGFYDESYRLIWKLLESNGTALPMDVLEDAVKLNRSLLKLPFDGKDESVNTSNNIYELYNSMLANESIPVEFEPRTYFIEKKDESYNSLDDWFTRAVWWGNKSGAYFHEKVSVK